ncbi:MAG: hypothetical protein RL077_565 [Verrucomicrobiota bacterium]|jgi:hypothetical protein
MRESTTVRAAIGMPCAPICGARQHAHNVKPSQGAGGDFFIRSEKRPGSEEAIVKNLWGEPDKTVGQGGVGEIARMPPKQKRSARLEANERG